MATDDKRDHGREFRLEGAGLVVVALVLLVGFAAAFYLGRWYERRGGPQAAAGAEGGGVEALAHVAEPGETKDAEDSLTYFDTADGPGKAAEPEREARPRERAKTPSPPAAAEAGTHFVQVFAGRSRSSAEELIKRLQQGGYAARLQTDARGGEQLYKVQVGYGDENAARAAVDELRRQGYPSAFYVAR